MSFEFILPFLRPIADQILDPSISEIMIVPRGRVFVERSGRISPLDVSLDERHVRVAAKHIARSLGEEISESRALLDARLPDGSRVAAVFPPCSVGGTTLTIRKFSPRAFTVDDLVNDGFLDVDMLKSLTEALDRRENILISGGTGTGKTTLLNALAALFPRDERIIVIEDTSELRLAHPNLVRLEARRAGPDTEAISIADVLRASLRHRPDRILLGEVRGPEAFDLLQALNTGHSGSISTIHANSAHHALSRLTTCVVQTGFALPHQAITRLIADAIHLVVHLERRKTARRATAVMRVEGMEPDPVQRTIHGLTASPL